MGPTPVTRMGLTLRWCSRLLLSLAILQEAASTRQLGLMLPAISGCSVDMATPTTLRSVRSPSFSTKCGYITGLKTTLEDSTITGILSHLYLLQRQCFLLLARATVPFRGPIRTLVI